MTPRHAASVAVAAVSMAVPSVAAATTAVRGAAPGTAPYRGAHTRARRCAERHIVEQPMERQAPQPSVLQPQGAGTITTTATATPTGAWTVLISIRTDTESLGETPATAPGDNAFCARLFDDGRAQERHRRRFEGWCRSTPPTGSVRRSKDDYVFRNASTRSTISPACPR